MKKDFLQQIKNVYKDSFPEDSQAYVDYFFKHKVRSDNVVYLEVNGEVASNLHLIDRNIAITGKSFFCPFIVAAGTHSNHRRKGYMAIVIKNTLHKLYSADTFVVALNPFDYRFYAKYGFSPFTYASEYTVSYRANKNFTYTIESLSRQDFLTFYKNVEEGYFGYTIRKDAESGKVLDELFSDGGEAFIIAYADKGEKKTFYALCDGNSIAETSLFADSISTRKVFSSIKEFNGFTVTLFNGREAQPFNMLRIVNVRKILSQLNYKKAVTKTICIKVTDSILAQNNIILKLTIKNGTATVEDSFEFTEEVTVEQLVELIFFNRIINSDFANISKKCNSSLAGIFVTADNVNFDKF